MKWTECLRDRSNQCQSKRMNETDHRRVWMEEKQPFPPPVISRMGGLEKRVFEQQSKKMLKERRKTNPMIQMGKGMCLWNVLWPDCLLEQHTCLSKSNSPVLHTWHRLCEITHLHLAFSQVQLCFVAWNVSFLAVVCGFIPPPKQTFVGGSEILSSLFSNIGKSPTSSPVCVVVCGKVGWRGQMWVIFLNRMIIVLFCVNWRGFQRERGMFQTIWFSSLWKDKQTIVWLLKTTQYNKNSQNQNNSHCKHNEWEWMCVCVWSSNSTAIPSVQSKHRGCWDKMEFTLMKMEGLFFSINIPSLLKQTYGSFDDDWTKHDFQYLSSFSNSHFFPSITLSLFPFPWAIQSVQKARVLHPSLKQSPFYQMEIRRELLVFWRKQQMEGMWWLVLMLDLWWFKGLHVRWIKREDLKCLIKELNWRDTRRTWGGNQMGVPQRWLDHNQWIWMVCVYECDDWLIGDLNHHIPSHPLFLLHH